MPASPRCADAPPAAARRKDAVPLLDAEAGLDGEAALLERVTTGAIDWSVVFWRSEPAIVVPRPATRWPGFAEAARAMAGLGWPVVLRGTGGGLMPQAPGLLNVAVSFRAHPSPTFGIDAAYRLFCAPLIEALARLGVEAGCGAVPGSLCDGAFNLVGGGRKLAGTAQRWRSLPGGTGGVAILAQAVILCRADLEVLSAVANEFYRSCGLSSRVVAERHVTLAQLLPALATEARVEGLMSRLATEIVARLHHADFPAAAQAG